MKDKTHRFKVGNFDCIAVSDGTHVYAPPAFPAPAVLLFTNAPQEELERTLFEHDIQPKGWAEWVSPYLCLLVDTGQHRVLVDTGANGLDPHTGKLLQNLQAEGISPEEIDTVILTHGHPDHIGGNTDDDGKVVFPNARFVMWKKEWDFWTSEESKSMFDEQLAKVLFGVAQKNLPPIQGQLDLIDRETEIVPGISAVEAPGHTPGHIALQLSSAGEQFLYFADTLLHPIHAERPEWHSIVDLDPRQVEITRHRLLDRAASEKALVLSFHFPFPGLGHVVQEGERWEWKPVEGSG